ncbi:MAG: phage tail tape measure protein [Clostridia bacterium]|nr:phage tail tape measure protein [Clostridia bacterium]
MFYQQGLDTNEALALTTDTMKLATLAGNDFSTATQEMTSAIRGFKMEMDEGGRVADVYSNLAAHAAATVDDIAQAMARTASIANSAGMTFENTSAFLAQMIETTQESAENIGTSLKTIIARFTELKENVAGTADSEFDDLEYNKVDKALKSVGVSLKDVNGQFRNLDDVFLELSEKWDTLDRNTQRYVATIAAGSRQQSRFIAMMDNYDRTVQLMEYAADAEGKADEQFAKYADTMEYKLNQLSTKWEEFRV